MNGKDYYKTLGLDRNASEQDIKKAYRRLAQKYHPDKNKGDNEAEKKFKQINEAYETLSDKQKRSYYDQFGTTQGAAGAGQGGFSGFSGFQGQEGFDFGGGFADIFESFFGGGAPGAGARAKRGGPVRGEDIEASIKIKFEESFTGAERELEITKAETCQHCNGKGAEPGSKIITCKTCGGSGTIREVRNTLLGQVATSRACDTCRGEGEIPEQKCTVCHGTTRTRKKEKVKVKIPAGISNDSTLRLREKGEAGIKGGPHGDLYLHITVEPHKDYVRSGDDIHTEEKIHLLKGVLGDEIKAKTLEGDISLKIPPGTQSGKVFKLKNYGMPKVNSSQRGDHYIKIILDVPQKLSKKEKELYKQLAEEAGVEIKETGKDGFFSKFK
jgi:molecular chaperone DnaJ